MSGGDRQYFCRRACALTILAAGLAACEAPPDLDRSLEPHVEDAAYPDLAPVEQLIGTAATSPDDDADIAADLSARADGLQNRATQVQRTSGIDEGTRRRLNQQIATD